MMRYFRHLRGSPVHQSFVSKYGPGTTKQTAPCQSDNRVTISDIREVIETVYQSEAHLRVIDQNAACFAPEKRNTGT